jgi:hypothetical protein
MKTVKLYNIQFYLYLFIILFGLQHAFFKESLFAFDFYESLVKFIFVISAITVLASVVILIRQGVKSINREKIIEDEMKYLIFNLVLFYFLVIASLYLSGEIRS